MTREAEILRGSHGRLYFGDRFTRLKEPQEGNRSRPARRDARQLGLAKTIWRIEDGVRLPIQVGAAGQWWWLSASRASRSADRRRDPEEAEPTPSIASSRARRPHEAGKPLPRQGVGYTGRERAVLPSLVTAKLAVYEMRADGWSRPSWQSRSVCGRARYDACWIWPTARICGRSVANDSVARIHRHAAFGSRATYFPTDFPRERQPPETRAVSAVPPTFASPASRSCRRRSCERTERDRD